MNFWILANVDPDTEKLVDQIFSIAMPLIYAVAGLVLAFALIREGFKIKTDPENKGKHIRNLCWSIVGCVIIFVAVPVTHIIINRLIGIE